MEEWRVKWLQWADRPAEFAVGKCIGCGFLGKRTEALSPARLEEVPATERLPGRGLIDMVDGSPATPWCLLRVANLPAEIRDYGEWTKKHVVKDATNLDQLTTGRDFIAGNAHMVIARDRKCPEWYPYYEFLDPVQHREMRDMLRLEEDRKALATKLADMDRDTQLRLAALRAQAEDIAERRNRFTFRVAVGISIVGVILALAAIGATLYPDEIREWIR